MGAARIHATHRQVGNELLENPVQIKCATNGFGQKDDLRADRFGGFDHTAAGDLPASDNHEPMHQEHAEQFGVEITEHMPRVRTARGIRLRVVLP